MKNRRKALRCYYKALRTWQRYNRRLPKESQMSYWDGFRTAAQRLRPRAPLPDYIRADGTCVCPTCGALYWRHARHPDYEWLHVLCSGKAVKL